MKNIEVVISCKNAAFQQPNLAYELDRIMKQAKQKLEEMDKSGYDRRKIRDSNGNYCGFIRVNY